MTPRRTLVAMVIQGILVFLASAGARAAVPIDYAEVKRVADGIDGTVRIVGGQDHGAYRTIQAALDASSNGDTVIVLPSTERLGKAYRENLVFPPRAITLRSIDPLDPAIVAATVIDGGARGPVIQFANGAPRESRLLGFTITNGTGTGTSLPFGGGIYMQSASPTIAHNTITGNWAVLGGGLYVISSSPEIVDNRIINNTAQSLGGGVYLLHSPALIAGNEISGNIAGDSGSALNVEFSDSIIRRNVITGNVAGPGGAHPSDRAAVLLFSTAEFVENNIIIGNAALGAGGALYLAGTLATVSNNTIVANDGYGIALDNATSPIANTIIAFNTWGVVGDGARDGAMLWHNCVYGNTASDFCGIADPTGIHGNISADPGFVEPSEMMRNRARTANNDGPSDDIDNRGLHLRPASPCIDSGARELCWTDVDLDGHQRVVDGDLNGQAAIDIGAYEYLPADIDGDGVVRPADYALWNACLAGPEFAYPAGCELADLDGDNDVDLQDFARFGQTLN